MGKQDRDARSISDSGHVAKLIQLGSDPESIAEAQATAAKALRTVGVVYPHNACAATLSSFLIGAGISVPMTLGAGNLAARLKNNRGWDTVKVGQQMAGDVGVCQDNTPPAGADHIYLVVEVDDDDDDDKMVIADNQAQGTTHVRYASGKGGKTPTAYFLRASDDAPGVTFREPMQERRRKDVVVGDEDTNALPELFMDDGTPR